MVTLITGGSASGKSAYAEKYILSSGDPVYYYIATMEPFGGEALRRIEKHRKMRAGKGFITVECFRDIENAEVPEGANVLLEDLGNLTANELFGGGTDDPLRIAEGVGKLAERCGNLVIVTNEVFSEGAEYGEETEKYMKILAKVNRITAASADRVIEIVCGIPVVIKGDSL